MYLLNTNLNPGGYTITNITTYSGWANAGRAQQNYTVSFRRVGSNTFENPTVVTYSYSGSSPANTRVTLTGFSEANVDAILFDFDTPTQQNGGVGYKELDVFGYGAAPVSIPPTVSGSSSTNAYVVSAADLLQTTGVSSVSNALTINVGENNANSHGTLGSFTDGTFGPAGADGGYCIAGGTVTYLLNTNLNPGGYTITNIATYSGWANLARAQQNYTVSFRRVGSSNFVNPTVVTYSYSGSSPADTKVTLNGFAETNVNAIRFDFDTPAQQNGGVGYKELDVFGYGAAPVTVLPTGIGSSSTNPFAVSATDLLQTSLGGVDTSALQYFSFFTYGNVATLADGIFNTDATNNWAFPIGGGTLTYYLNTVAASGGYVVSNINVYGGWSDVSHDAQNYSVSYSTVSAPATFIPLTTVDFNPTVPGNTVPSYTSVAISAPASGVIASNVAAIRFSFSAQENNYVGYREIDVFGAASPPNPLAAVVSGIRAVTTPMRGATSLVLPTVPSGYSVAIKSSSNPGVVATNGVINPPPTNIVLQLVLTVTQTSNSQTADTGIIYLLVPASTGTTPWISYTDNFTMRRGLFMSWGSPQDGQINPVVFSDGSHSTTMDQFVTSVNVTAVANQIAGFGFEYVYLQNFHGYQTTLNPCAALDSWRGLGCTSTRDAVGELIAAFKARGIKVYLFTHPLDGYDGYTYPQQAAVGWLDATGNYQKWNDFINDVYAELTERYGDDIAGFDFDSDFGLAGGPLTYQKLDLARLRNTILSRRPQLSLGALVGPNNTAEMGIKEVFNPSWLDPWNALATNNYNVEVWPGYRRVPAVVQGYSWATIVPPAQGVAHLNGSQLFRYSVLQAAAATEGPGICWSVSPYTDGTWENGVGEAFTNLNAYVQPIAASLTNVLSSTSYPLVEGVKLSTLSNGIAATRSRDGSIEYVHVLNPPGGSTLVLPLPADGKRFTSATLLANGQAVTLVTNLTQISLTLTGTNTWSATDTVIKLLVIPATIPQPSLAFHKHVFASSSWEYGPSWGTTSPWGSIRLVDGQTTAFTPTNTWSAANYGFSTAVSSNGLSIGLSPTNRAEWVTIDLEATTSVNSVRLHPRNDSGNLGEGYPVNFDISTSTNGVSWTVATNLTSQPKPTVAQTFSFSTRSARYVRLNASQLRSNPGGTFGLQLSEFEVFGSSTPSGLAIQKIQNGIVVQWASGVLQSAGSLTGSFTDVGGAVSPYTNNPALGQQFYRLRN